MKVLVTGCAGLLGSNFCEWLPSHIEVIGIDDLSGGYVVPSRVNFFKLDLTNPIDQKEIEALFPVDYVFHFAAYAAEGLSPFIRQYNYRNNTLATAFLINQSIKHAVKRFVFTSSMAVYGKGQAPFPESSVPKPIDSYGIAKYACEMDLEVAWMQHGLEYCIIRPHNVYGPGQNIWDPYRNVIGIWLYKSLNGEAMTIYGSGEQTRAFSWIGDILPCLYDAAVSPLARNEIINLGGTTEISLNEASKIVSKVTGNETVEYLEERHEVKHAWSTYQKSIDILGYKQTLNLEDGIRIMWEWAKKQPPRERKYWTEYELDKGLYSFWKV